MTRYVAVCYFIDSSTYANAGKSSNPAVQSVYWHGITLLAASARRFSGDHSFLVFTNATPPDRFKVSWEKLGIEVVPAPFTYALPHGYFRAFGGAFYNFDAIEYMSSRMEPDDVLLILDPDCVVVDQLEPVFRDISDAGVMTYNAPYDETYPANGVSRIQLGEFLRIYRGEKGSPEALPYCGGEFVGLTGAAARSFAGRLRHIWRWSLARHEAGLPKCNVDEHVIAMAVADGALPVAGANRYIRRVWTAAVHRNVEPSDMDLTIWHLPSEKKRGLMRLARLALDPGSRFWTIPAEGFKPWAGPFVGVPKRNATRVASDWARRCAKRMIGAVRARLKR